MGFKGRNTYIGTFDTEEEAAQAYDAEAKRLRSNPVFNFLPDGSLNPDRKKPVSQQSLMRRRQPSSSAAASSARAASPASSASRSSSSSPAPRAATKW